ncbi:CPBP family intramembrane metalloprotease [Microbacterium sp. zg.Y1090]|uniref:CPBP family intramembrane glutamic endopeptidase n=1 Tax=Microbacterium wangruii TaxID=3049073 RepID=UPI00214C3FF6|nr:MULTISPECIES: type II CAAX endopeptidase family protein [unclassified Microbacterium]MCR2817291.1 CPBP family intramembrane metalloprotease [Microbacterium sp. zg.Y1090]MDL5486043.1 type II CAAX endopeptidase family protein [Microbacterium sp. zg-Y1211]WIM29221.1 type II CAAX endopeptidase family protein [Microbacterium sp. zg-Y1090]
MTAQTDTLAPGVEYHRVLAGDQRRIGRGILAIVLLIGGMFFLNILFAAVAVMVNSVQHDGGAAYTPLLHAAGMASVALLTPWSMLIQRWLYGVKGASLHSVFSRFRFDLFAKALLLVVPAWSIVSVVLYWSPLPEASWSHTDVLWFLLATILLTPLQGAGEEYGFRGLIFRVAGGWARGAGAGLVLGIVVSSVLFAIVHLSTDVWLNAWYLVFAVGLSLITWRTGGIEIAIVLHAMFNTVNFVFDVALRVDIGTAYDRSAGVASVETLVPMAVIVVAVVVVWVRTRGVGVVRVPVNAEARGVAVGAV